LIGQLAEGCSQARLDRLFYSHGLCDATHSSHHYPTRTRRPCCPRLSKTAPPSLPLDPPQPRPWTALMCSLPGNSMQGWIPSNHSCFVCSFHSRASAFVCFFTPVVTVNELVLS
jgi:hypothetical protein